MQQRIFSILKSRASFLTLLALLFMLRGLAIQCLYPPLEGFDEYQHIAYITYLLENHSLPEMGKALVPKSLYPALVANPHPDFSWQHTSGIGALRYDQFFHRTVAPTPGSQDIDLYQAQHPPLYHIAAAPIFALTKAQFGFRTAVYALRFVNIAVAAIALLLLLLPLQRLLVDEVAYRTGALAISLLPMFMIYAARVSNDALAMLFAGLAVYGLIEIPRSRTPTWKAFLVGTSLGLGVLTKATVLAFLPVSIAYLLYLAGRSKLLWRRFFSCATIIITTYLVICLPYHLYNWRRFGVPVFSVDTLANKAAGKTLRNYFWAMLDVEDLYEFLDKLFLRNLWLSGWSFLEPAPLWVVIYAAVLGFCLAGVGFHLLSRRRGRAFSLSWPSPSFMLCLLIAGSTFLLNYFNSLMGIVAYDAVYYPYYAMIGYPAFLSCVLAASQGYGRRISIGLSIGLAAVFAMVEIDSLLRIGAPYWASATDWPTIFARLASVHPAFPSPVFLPGLWLSAVFVVLIIITNVVLQARDRQAPVIARAH
jgi:4-amino-4-deoxy-L-arabinose transferase-like glycosyltransferase